ncbi:MAG: biopolymer transporter ExbD [Bacteroidia bacterium]|nr:biopolymer transporter ExbD [Bacteroidia bacterium]
MNIRRKKREGVEVFTDSLNDIMFFLLLFFLILSTLANPSVIKVNLPTSKNNVDVETQPVFVYMNAERQYYVNRKMVDYFNLEKAIQQEIGTNPKATLSLNFDNSLTVQDLVEVMEIGAKLKTKMVIATKPANAN